MREKIDRDLTAYKNNYAVYILRVEMKDLGRQMKRNEKIWSDSHKEQVKLRMAQIKEVLYDLKVKLIH